MIEVEIKCLPTSEQKEKLLKDAKFVSEKTTTEVYYDLQNYSLLKNDSWLRIRNGKFMFKTANISDSSQTTSKHEFENEQEILKQLSLVLNKNFENTIENAGYKPVFSFVKTRKRYKINDITIDMDSI